MVHGGVAAVMEPPKVRAAFHAAPDGMWTLEAVHLALSPAFGDAAPSAGFICEDTLTLATETIGFPARDTAPERQRAGRHDRRRDSGYARRVKQGPAGYHQL